MTDVEILFKFDNMKSLLSILTTTNNLYSELKNSPNVYHIMRKAGFSKGCKFYIAQSIVSERIVMSLKWWATANSLKKEPYMVQVNYYPNIFHIRRRTIG